MTDFRKIFIDTAPIIYYLQNSELYYNNMRAFWNKYDECDYVTSAITVTEYLTYPYRQSDLKMVESFYAFVNDMDIQVKEIDVRIAEKAAQIRAEYKFFKTMDSLQLMNWNKRKRALDFSNALVYNLIRKVIGCVIRLPSVATMK